MEAYRWVDGQGRACSVYDFKIVGSGPDAKKRAVPIGRWSGEARAFVPADGDGQVLIYNFGLTPYRRTRDRTLGDQLRFANPLGANAAHRMAGGSSPQTDV